MSGFQTRPDVVFAASVRFLDIQRFVRDIASGLVGDLHRSAGMAGDDDAGRAFAARYQPAAVATVKAIGVLGGLAGAISGRLLTMAWNYLLAEDAIAVSFRAPAMGLEGRPKSSQYDCDPGSQHQQLPEVVGHNNWAVDHLVTPFWPQGDPDKLRAAGRTWRKAAQLLAQVGVDCGKAVQPLYAECEGPALDAFAAYANRVLGYQDCSTGISAGSPLLPNLVGACQQLAAVCERYAHLLEELRGHLKRIYAAGAAATAIGIAASVVTLGGSGVAAGAADAALAAEAGAAVAEAVAAVEAEALVIAEAEAILARAAASLAGELVVPAVTMPAALTRVELPEDSRVDPAGTRAELAAVTGAASTGIVLALAPAASTGLPWQWEKPIAPPVPPVYPPLSPLEQREVKTWAQQLPKRAPAYGTPDDIDYQRKVAGSPEFQLPAGEEQVWADGVRFEDGAAIDAKHVRDPRCTTRTLEGLRRSDFFAQKMLGDDIDELERYREAVHDPSGKIRLLEIHTDYEPSVAYWEFLRTRHHVPGYVRYTP